MKCDWLVPPANLKLLPGQLHVWRLVQDEQPASFEYYWSLLSADEQHRANRFHFERDRMHFVVARGVLRMLIGRYLVQPPQDIVFTYSKYGKPALPLLQDGSNLQFNVSHSGGLALLAFCWDAAVGIDVERKRPLPHSEQIAERFFSEQENQIFKSLPAEQRSPAFFNGWTRKEAYIKAIGEGLSCPLDAFDVTLAPGEPARLLRIHGRKQAASAWSLHAFTPRPDYTAALAVTGRDWQLSFWQWLNFPGAAGGTAK